MYIFRKHITNHCVYFPQVNLNKNFPDIVKASQIGFTVYRPRPHANYTLGYSTIKHGVGC